MNRRLSIVDLTSAPAPVSLSSRRSTSALSGSTIHSSSSPIAESHATARGAKRKRQSDEDDDQLPSSPPVSRPQITPHVSQEPVESIDLTEVSDSSALAKALAKQREDAIKAQPTDQEKGRSMLANYQCPVCMDTPEDATSTSCGHLFCHKCIVQYLQSIDDSRIDNTKQSKGTCPVCRKNITKNDSSGPRRSLIPLKLKLITKKRIEVLPNDT